MKREKSQTFTYSGKPSVRKKAIRKASKEGLKFSEVVEALLNEYIRRPEWKSVETGERIPAVTLLHEFSGTSGPSLD